MQNLRSQDLPRELLSGESRAVLNGRQGKELLSFGWKPNYTGLQEVLQTAASYSLGDSFAERICTIPRLLAVSIAAFSRGETPTTTLSPEMHGLHGLSDPPTGK